MHYMQTVLSLGLLILSYLIGSIPFGLLIVRLRTGKDIRQVESGRTGGTNAMRAAGFGAGFATATLDLLKSAVTVWIARAVVPGNAWLETLAPVAAVIGHNYSIFLIERSQDGKIRLRGGAGGAPTTGGAFGLWPPCILFMLPVGALILYFGASPWQYILYGILTEIILINALRPNIRRLLNGTERVVGFRARRMKKNHYSSSSSSSS
jgi:glycerol-3-phosphate acyltransferase PlsY